MHKLKVLEFHTDPFNPDVVGVYKDSNVIGSLQKADGVWVAHICYKGHTFENWKDTDGWVVAKRLDLFFQGVSCGEKTDKVAEIPTGTVPEQQKTTVVAPNWFGKREFKK